VGSVNLLLLAVWALTRRGYFWPEWTLLPLGFLLFAHGWLVFVARRPQRWPLTRPLAGQLGISAALWCTLVGVWAVTTRAYFWPVWVLLGFLVVAGLHLTVVVLVSPSRRQLVERVGVLTATRAAAVEEQEARLRRIERDLHDGAQARLVALGMTLALAEQRFRDDPDGARELVGEARSDARVALQELRALAHGIHPPVLTDRGLGPAIEALAATTPLHVELRCDLDARATPGVEAAAYFVVAEALANTAKHAAATRVTINVMRDADRLRVEIGDDGHGGADPAGSGLTGLRQRVEAVDGSLTLTSPSGGPTVVRAEIPCGS
jgi:signal transduction histidine kinase